MATALVALISSASPALAQGFVSPFIGVDFGGDSGCQDLSTCEDKNANFGVAIGSLGSVLGSELEIGYARNFFGDTPDVSASVLTVMGNVMIAPKFGPAQPYGTVGLGLIKTRVELTSSGLLDSSNNHFGWNLGGGLIVFLGRHVGVRGDVRYFHSFQELDLLGVTFTGTKLDFGRAAAGLVLRF